MKIAQGGNFDICSSKEQRKNGKEYNKITSENIGVAYNYLKPIGCIQHVLLSYDLILIVG